MAKKQAISIIIIILALAGAGVLLYLLIFSSAPAPVATTTAPNPILPHGNNLDFSAVTKFNEAGNRINYPKVTPAEIGQPLNSIIQQ